MPHRMTLERFSRLARFLGAVFAAVVHPIAWPAWAIERLVQRRSSDWQFSAYSATPYLSTLAMAGTICVMSKLPLLQIVGIYILFALELLGIWLCIAIFSGNRQSAFWVLLIHHGKRKVAQSSREVFVSTYSIYCSGIAFLYTTYFFAIAHYAVHSYDALNYDGVRSGSAFQLLWQFLYFSIVTITAFGHGKLMPASAIGEALSGLEMLIGLFLVLFLFGGFAAYHVGRLKR
jgi:hypothetical protein